MSATRNAALTEGSINTTVWAKKVDFGRQKSQHMAKNNGVFSIDEQSHQIPAHAVILWDRQQKSI